MLIESLPIGLTLGEAARRLGQTYQATRHHILKFGYPAVDSRKFAQSAKRKLDPAKIDWSQSNVTIAAQCGVSRERVRSVRQQLKLPRVESRGRKPNHELCRTIRNRRLHIQKPESGVRNHRLLEANRRGKRKTLRSHQRHRRPANANSQ